MTEVRVRVDPEPLADDYRGFRIVTYRQERFTWNARLQEHGKKHKVSFLFGDPFDSFTRARALRKTMKHIDRIVDGRLVSSQLDAKGRK